jgi:hypothetical protein
MFLESEGGWFGAEFPQLARKGESLDPDPRMGGDDDEAVSQPKKPLPKAKRLHLKRKHQPKPLRRRVKRNHISIKEAGCYAAPLYKTVCYVVLFTCIKW